MKGLLYRLAARAAGTAVPLRSDARLPFGGGEFGWADPGEPAPALTAKTAPASSAARVDAGAAQAPVRTPRVGSEDKLPLSMVPPRLDGVEPSREPMPAATKFSPHDAEVVAPDIAGVGDGKTVSHATAPLAERDPIDLTVQAPPEADLPIERVHRTPVPRAVPDPLLPTEAERSRADLAPLMPQAPAGLAATRADSWSAFRDIASAVGSVAEISAQPESISATNRRINFSALRSSSNAALCPHHSAITSGRCC